MKNDDGSNQDVTSLGRQWKSASGPGDPQEIGVLSEESPTGFGVAPMDTKVILFPSLQYPVDPSAETQLFLNATLTWGLTFNLWKFTPIEESGEFGTPIKVLSCRTDPDTALHSPELFQMSAGEIDPSMFGHEGSLPKTKADADWAKAHGITGPYLESVNIQMGFDDPRAVLTENAPETSTEHGSVSTTISYSFNFGFFGTAATAGLTSTYSHTASMELTDYIIRNDSDDSKTNHTIKMQMWGDGNLYNADSLSPHPLTEKATSKMPLALAGIWELPGDVNDRLLFHPRITATYVMIGLSGGYGYRLLPDGKFTMTVEQLVYRVNVNFDNPVEIDFAHPDPIDLESPPLPSSVGQKNGNGGN